MELRVDNVIQELGVQEHVLLAEVLAGKRPRRVRREVEEERGNVAEGILSLYKRGSRRREL